MRKGESIELCLTRLDAPAHVVGSMLATFEDDGAQREHGNAAQATRALWKELRMRGDGPEQPGREFVGWCVGRVVPVALGVARSLNGRAPCLCGAMLRGVDLRGLDLRDADMIGVDLIAADLRNADLRGANLFNYTDTVHTKWDGAKVRGARFDYNHTFYPRKADSETP